MDNRTQVNLDEWFIRFRWQRGFHCCGSFHPPWKWRTIIVIRYTYGINANSLRRMWTGANRVAVARFCSSMTRNFNRVCYLLVHCMWSALHATNQLRDAFYVSFMSSSCIRMRLKEPNVSRNVQDIIIQYLRFQNNIVAGCHTYNIPSLRYPIPIYFLQFTVYTSHNTSNNVAECFFSRLRANYDLHSSSQP